MGESSKYNKHSKYDTGKSKRYECVPCICKSITDFGDFFNYFFCMPILAFCLVPICLLASTIVDGFLPVMLSILLSTCKVSNVFRCAF